MTPHPLTNFAIQKYQNEPRFNGVYSTDNLLEHSSTEIKDGVHVINLDKYSDIGTHWVALYVQNNVTYFNSLTVEHRLKGIRTFISYKNIKKNVFRIQSCDSIMCGYFCIAFIDFMVSGKTLPEFTNLFSTNKFLKNDDIILKYFVTNI